MFSPKRRRTGDWAGIARDYQAVDYEATDYESHRAEVFLGSARDFGLRNCGAKPPLVVRSGASGITRHARRQVVVEQESATRASRLCRKSRRDGTLRLGGGEQARALQAEASGGCQSWRRACWRSSYSRARRVRKRRWRAALARRFSSAVFGGRPARRRRGRSTCGV